MVRAAALALLLLPMPALAQEAGPWDDYLNDPVVAEAYPWGTETPEYLWESDGAYSWVYERDIRRENGNVTAWIRENYKTPIANGTAALMTRITFDCQGRSRRSAQTSYRADGTVIQDIDRLEDWVFVRPDSGYDVYSQALCRSPAD